MAKDFPEIPDSVSDPQTTIFDYLSQAPMPGLDQSLPGLGDNVSAMAPRPGDNTARPGMVGEILGNLPDVDPLQLPKTIPGKDQPGLAWSYQLERVNCCKSKCSKCPHGPYWYAYRKAGGKVIKKYLGKNGPNQSNAKDETNSLGETSM